MEAGPFISYAQNFEDVMLWRALGRAVEGAGFYIDVGASDPTALSVTRAFYDRGWRGLNVEPLPEAARALRAARPRDVTVEAAAAAAPGRRVFHRVVQDEQTGLSTLDAVAAAAHRAGGAVVETLEVEAVTLAALCRAHVQGAVHILKVDAEGAEGEVLAGADFAVVRPWVVVVEATRPASADAAGAEWEPGLLAAGYRCVWFDGLNRFFLAEEHAALARHFELPPNVFDHYVQHNPALEQHLVRTTGLAEERAALIVRLEAEVARLSAALEDVPEPVQAPAPSVGPALPSMVPGVALGVAPGVAPGVASVAAPPAAPAVRPPRGAMRRLVGRVARKVMPVVRPWVHRGRAFMTDELGLHMIDMRAKQDLVMARLEAVELMLRNGGGAQGVSDGQADVLNRALLTLALMDGERGGDGPKA